MITTDKGIAILNSGDSPEEHIKMILRFKNADNIEQLTASEIKEVNEMLEDFKDAILNPLDVSTLDFHFHFPIRGKLHEVYIGKVSKLDMSLTTLMQFEQLEAGKWESVPYLIACVYAPVVNAMFDLKQDNGTRILPFRTIQELTNVFMGMDFKVIYGLYAFFLSYKTAYLQKSNLSIQAFEKRYHRQVKRLKKRGIITPSSATFSKRRKSKNYSRSTTGLSFYGRTLKTIAYLCIALGMARFMRFTTKRRRSS